MLRFGHIGRDFQRLLVGCQRFGSTSRALEGVTQKQKSSIGRMQLDRVRIIVDRFRQFVLLFQQLTEPR